MPNRFSRDDLHSILNRWWITTHSHRTQPEIITRPNEVGVAETRDLFEAAPWILKKQRDS